MKRTMRKRVKKFVCVLMALSLIFTGIDISEVKTIKVARAASSVVERAISWAVSIANDNSHGYSQTSRWGPDYDCSSFVISAFKNAGVNVGTATYTGNMRAQFTQHGFQWIPWSQIGGVSRLQRGDILLNEVQHTEIYLGNNQNVGAHSNRGYPQTGDQTGTEVSVSGYYYHPWNGVLRYIGNNVCTCSASYAGDYYVSTNSLPLTMRSGHGTGYSVITSIPKGSKVYVSRADGNWAHVEWNGYRGYCSMSYLTRITSKSYNLHVWVSDTKMGAVPSDFVKGKGYYLCYELIDESTGKKANETSSINYTATETIRNSSGKVFEHSYKNSDYNWIWIECSSEDTYTGVVTISGDIEISCGVSFNVFAKTSPQIKIWAWDNNDTIEIRSVDVGKTAYCSYLIRDKYTEKNLNDVTSFWTQGAGYTVTIKVYEPSGSLIKTQSYKNNDCTWFSFVPDRVGEYKIKASVTGNLSGGQEKTIKAEEKEHKYGSWTITRKATCEQKGIKTRTCTICKKTETETIEKTKHTYKTAVVTKSATCEKAGEKTYTCSICGTKKYEVIPATNHNIVVDKGFEPTETETGLTDGSHCSLCGEIFTIQKVIPAIGQTTTPKPTVTVKPTVEPTAKPTAKPTVKPTAKPTAKPTVEPATEPDVKSNREPSETWDIDEEDDDSYDDSDEEQEFLEGMVLKDRKRGVSYKVLKQGEVALYKVNNRKIKKIVIPNVILSNGVRYKVTAISNNVFNNCKRLKYVTIGKNVSVIGSKAFYKCKSLKKIVLPNTVVKIGKKAFYGCRKLKLVIVKSPKLERDTVGTQAFGGTNNKMTIKVPKNRKKEYAKWLWKKGFSKKAKII